MVSYLAYSSAIVRRAVQPDCSGERQSAHTKAIRERNFTHSKRRLKQRGKLAFPRVTEKYMEYIDIQYIDISDKSMSERLPAPAASNTFERIKRVNAQGQESWSARDLARVLEYLNFRNFQPVIEKAKEACANSGYAVADHFAEMRNMVGIGSGAKRELEDWALSRYACYLVIQKEHLLDRMGSTELAANLFRATQTEEKLRRENVRNKDQANRIHEAVGRTVRRTIHELGGTMPENLPVAENIKKVEGREKKRLKARQKKIAGNQPGE
jgi:DNA-damage-inducible protein D